MLLFLKSYVVEIDGKIESVHRMALKAGASKAGTPNLSTAIWRHVNMGDTCLFSAVRNSCATRFPCVFRALLALKIFARASPGAQGVNR
jgi:hypothetical protein